jgi:hypothetical protein
MASAVDGQNVVYFERALMQDALNRCVPHGTHARMGDLVAALRKSRQYGVYFSNVNRRGLRNTLSRWLRANVFPNHILVSGVGVMHTDGLPTNTKSMTLDFNIPNQTMKRLESGT